MTRRCLTNTSSSATNFLHSFIIRLCSISITTNVDWTPHTMLITRESILQQILMIKTRAICIASKCVCGRGSSRTPLGSFQRSPRSPNWIWGKGLEKREMERTRVGKGTEREKKQEKRRAKKRGGRKGWRRAPIYFTSMTPPARHTAVFPLIFRHYVRACYTQL